MNRREIRARLVYLEEVLEDGEYGLAVDIVHDLLAEFGGPVVQTGRCRFCGLVDWPGVVVRHERVVHPHEVLDLEEKAA